VQHSLPTGYLQWLFYLNLFVDGQEEEVIRHITLERVSSLLTMIQPKILVFTCGIISTACREDIKNLLEDKHKDKILVDFIDDPKALAEAVIDQLEKLNSSSPLDQSAQRGKVDNEHSSFFELSLRYLNSVILLWPSVKDGISYPENLIPGKTALNIVLSMLRVVDGGEFKQLLDKAKVYPLEIEDTEKLLEVVQKRIDEIGMERFVVEYQQYYAGLASRNDAKWLIVFIDSGIGGLNVARTVDKAFPDGR